MPEVGWPAVFLPTFYGRVGDEKKEPVAPAIPEGSEMRASEMSNEASAGEPGSARSRETVPESSKSSRVSRAARPSRRTGHTGGKCTICLEDLTVASPNPSPNPDLGSNPNPCLLYTSPSPRDKRQSRMPSSA